MRQDQNVLVVGAGPTGLTMAIELRRAGIPVRLIDKAEQAAQYSQALVVQARTLEQFERYGIAEKAVALGRKLHGGSLYSEGKRIVHFQLDEIPGRYRFALFLPQSETERLLTERLLGMGGQIERGTELLSYTNGKDGIEAQLRHKSGTVQTVAARWLVGCDGAHSMVRGEAHVPFKGEAVGLDFFLGDLEMSGPDVPGDEINIHLHHGNVVFFGRLDEKLVRVIVIMQRGGDQPPVTRQPELADFQSAIDRSGARVRVSAAAWMTPFHINERKAEKYRIKSAFLAGDASHIHSPVGGQGMNTGIQDAANLAWKLAAVADGASAELLDTYDEERGKVGDDLLKATSRGLSLVTSANPIVERLRDFLAPMLTNFEPVKHAMAGFVAETAIEYRSSSIAADYGGDGELRAGDRVPNPDVEYAGGKRGRLLDALADGRALAIGIGVDDMRKIRARVPRAHFLELRSTEGMLGTEIEVPPDEAIGERPGYHPVEDEFPASGAAQPGKQLQPLPEIGLLTPEIEKLLGSEHRVLVMRPDGYLGFRGSIDDLARLDDYARLTGLA